MTSALFHPDFKASPYWWEAWRPNADGSADLSARAHVAIVGAGYGSLATAFELRRVGTAVVVIETNEFGSGASSRNGGAVSGGNRHFKEQQFSKAHVRLGSTGEELSLSIIGPLLPH